jgi:PAS domain S-box-containing protein
MVWVACALAAVFAALWIRERGHDGDDAEYRSIADGAPSGMVVIDADTVLYANRRILSIIGLDPDESIVGRTFDEVLSPETAVMARDGYQTIVAGDAPVWVEDFPVTGRNGRVVRCDLTFIPIQFNGHRAVQGAFVPVDEIHDATTALAESEERFRRFFEDMPVPMYRTRVDGTIVNANRALASLLGIDDPSELAGVNASDFYVEEGERSRLADIQLSQGLLEDQISLLAGWNGQRVWVRDSSHTIEDDDQGQIFEGALVDVTEGQQATQQLMVRALQQQALADIGRVALQSLETGDVLSRAVEKICEVLGAECVVLAQKQEDHGLLITTAAYGTDSTRRREQVFAYLQNNIVLGVDTATPTHFNGDDRGRKTDLAGISLEIGGSDGPYGAMAVCGSRLDLTADDLIFLGAAAAMLGSAIERARARSHLERLMRSKDEFVASVSHELRTPLTVVAGLALELESHWRGFSSAEIAEFISLIADQSREMSDLIEDLLVAARADIGKVPIHPEKADLRSSIDQVVSSCSLADRARITVVGEDVAGWVDPVRFRQVIRNLVTNAVRYGGPRIHVRVAESGDDAVVTVFDDGVGIPEPYRDRIFDPYERAHSTSGVPGSVGLGLSVSQKLVELMGGTIRYRFEGGSVFEVRLAGTASRF